MRRLSILVIGLIALLSITLPQLMAQDDQANTAPSNSILQWVDSEPLAGQELGLDSPIELYFDRPIDCATVGDAFSITPNVEGTLTCDGSRISFTPSISFDQANTYLVSFDLDLRGIDGTQLFEPLVIEFDTVGFIQITETFPSPDTFEIELDTNITVIFNRPIVPLTLFDAEEELINPLIITPPIEGTGEWVNTAIYVFEPDSFLQSATDYTVEVLPDLVAQDGATMASDYSFNFTTQPPTILDFSPAFEQDDVELDRAIQVRFNLAMDQNSVEENFVLSPSDGDPVSGTFEWAEDGAGFRFIPDDDLLIDTTYDVAINSDNVQGLNGGQGGLEGVTDWYFSTVLYPAINRTDPPDDTITRPLGGFIIYFDSPMNQDNFADFITIEPEPEFEPRYYWRSWSNSVEVAFQPYASATYTVTVEAGLEDVYGNTIDEDYSFSYETMPFTPEVNLRVPSGIGFYNAERDPTSLFVTYRNTEEFSVELYNVNMTDFGDYLIRRGYYRDPSLANVGLEEAQPMVEWTIDGSEIPENALRFDLLEFDANMGINNCPQAMPTRLLSENRAIVISDPDPVRARSAPVDGEIVDLLYVDYALTLLDNPICGSDGLLWYPVQLRDETTAWIAESVDEEYLIAPIDGANTMAVPVGDELGNGLAPGIYYLRVEDVDTETPSRGYNRSHIMVVSNANLVVKHTLDSMMIWATDVQTGLPIPNAAVTVYGDNGEYREVASGITNADGVLTLAIPEPLGDYQRRVIVLESENYFGVGSTEWSSGIQPYQFGQRYTYYPSEYSIYMYTDRPVYRPGQPVYIRGIVRQQDDIAITPPDIDTVPVYVANGFGDTIFEGDVPLNEYGSFNLELDLADDVQLGFYSAVAEIETARGYYNPRGQIRFNVAEYRLPEFLVDVEATTEEVVQGGTVEVTVDSTYFFGGSVSDATVEYSVIAENYFFRYEGAGRYDFIDYNYDSGPSAFYASSERGTIASGMDVTNEQGEFVIEIPAELSDAAQSQNFIVEATVRDETGQSVSGRGTVTVHQGEVYIGARAEQYVGRAEEESTINIIAVDWDSEAVSNQNIDVEVVERRWSSVQERDPNGRTVWTWEVEEIPISDGEVTTDDNGQVQYSFTPPNGGSYKIYITTRDANGNEVRSSTYVWVSSRRYVSWRQQNSNRIDLIANAEEFSVGDTAEILIASPFQGTAEALVTVERGDVLSYEYITMDTNSYLYELPITENYAPNVFVSVFIVKGVDENNPVAAFRMGYIQFSVDPERHELNIDISANVDRTSPQETVIYTVTTSDWEGNPVSAEVGVAVTDLAALSLAPDASRPIFNHFFSDLSLSVQTATPLTFNADQLTQEVLDTVKGGGGGIIADGIIEIRGEFIDTPYWNPSIITDANGTATFDVRLPDNLTTWRLDARAITLAEDGNLLVGQNTFDLLSTKLIIIRPVTPRFFVLGDEVVLSAVVNNNTTEPQDVVVTLDYAGVTLLDDNRAQVVNIAADGRARVTWRVRVDQEFDFAQFSFVADASNFTDGAISGVSMDEEGSIPIYRYAPPEVGDTVGTAGVLESAESRVETIYLPERFNVSEGVLTVQVEQSLAATTVDGLNYLIDSPHRSTISTVSRFLPNITTFRALDSFDLADDNLENGLNRNVNFAIQKLISEQHTDGGWGWYVTSRSSSNVTAYILIGLAEARNQGLPVPDRVLDRAQEFLRANLIAIDANTSTWRANQQAFVLYALALSGDADIARTEVLFRNRDDLSLYARALLAETFWYIDITDTSRSDVLLNDIASRAVTSAAGIHWDEDFIDYWNWNTDTRTTAIILRTFVRLRPNSDLIPNIVRYLMVERRADYWETYQETAWSLMALTDWMVASGELNPDYAYDVSLNGETRLDGTATNATARDTNVLFVDVAELLQGEANRLVFTRTGSNDGNLYYSAYLTAYLEIPDLEPISSGATITRSYSLQNDPDDTPITEANVGDVIEVRLTMVLPNSMNYVMVYDPLPAGAEGINPNLTTSQQIGTRPSINRTNPLRYGWGWWWFSNTEFRDEAVVLHADFLPAGTYEYVYAMRAGVEGTYNVIPPSVQQVYFPDVYGRGAGLEFIINPAP